MNSYNILCGFFELFPSYVVGVLDSVKDISFYVLCNEKPNYADYIKKCISGKSAQFRKQNTIFSYLMEKLFIYYLKQESYMKSFHLN
jgi:hypothetical protein